MNISPLAGKPAERALLVNVPRLVTVTMLKRLTFRCRGNVLLLELRAIELVFRPVFQ